MRREKRELPDGWRWTHLGRVAKYINGRAFKPEEWVDRGLPIIRIENLNSEDAPFHYYDKPVEERYIVRDGDLLISWSASLDAFIWSRGKAILNQHIFKVEEDENIVHREFLYYVVRSVMDKIRSQVHGATMRHITKGKFEAVEIPLPPLREQQRIVAVLNERLATIKRARVAAEAQLEAARALPAVYLRAVFEGDEAKKWCQKTLGQVCKTTSGGTPSRRVVEYYMNGTIPWVKSGELDDGIITKTEESITHKAIERSSAKIFPSGTLLIALYGATVGKLGILDIDAATNQAVCAIFTNDTISRDYLFFYLLYYRKRLLKDSFGGAQPNISQTVVRGIRIPLPSIERQREIETFLFDKLETTKKIVSGLQPQLDEIKQLPTAYLRQAFRGEL